MKQMKSYLALAGQKQLKAKLKFNVDDMLDDLLRVGGGLLKVNVGIRGYKSTMSKGAIT